MPLCCRYITAQKLYMLDTHQELFKRFKEANPGVKLGLRKFIDLAPWCVNTCIIRYLD